MIRTVQYFRITFWCCFSSLYFADDLHNLEADVRFFDLTDLNMIFFNSKISVQYEYDKSAPPCFISGSLYILYPGLYVLGAIMFVPAMFLMKRDQQRLKEEEYVTMNESTRGIENKSSPSYDSWKCKYTVT